MGLEYLTAKEAGKKWGITARMAAYHCEAGRIPGAIKKGNLWLVPNDAIKPADKRRKKDNREGHRPNEKNDIDC
jgi:hypothetical protein